MRSSPLAAASARCLALSSGSSTISARRRCIARRRAGVASVYTPRVSSGWVKLTRCPSIWTMPLFSASSRIATTCSASVSSGTRDQLQRGRGQAGGRKQRLAAVGGQSCPSWPAPTLRVCSAVPCRHARCRRPWRAPARARRTDCRPKTHGYEAFSVARTIGRAARTEPRACAPRLNGRTRTRRSLSGCRSSSHDSDVGGSPAPSRTVASTPIGPASRRMADEMISLLGGSSHCRSSIATSTGDSSASRSTTDRKRCCHSTLIGHRSVSAHPQQNPIDGKTLWRRQPAKAVIVQLLQQPGQRRIGQHRLRRRRTRRQHPKPEPLRLLKSGQPHSGLADTSFAVHHKSGRPGS